MTSKISSDGFSITELEIALEASLLTKVKRLQSESERLACQAKMLVSQISETQHSVLVMGTSLTRGAEKQRPVHTIDTDLRRELQRLLVVVANGDALLTTLVNCFFTEAISEKIVTAKGYLGLSDEERTYLLQLLVSEVEALSVKNQKNMCHFLHELFKMVNAMMQYQQNFSNLQNVVKFFVDMTTLPNLAEVQDRLKTFFDKVFRKINKKTMDEVLIVLYSVKNDPDDFEFKKDAFIAKYCTSFKLVEKAKPAETVKQPKQPVKKPVQPAKDSTRRKPRHRKKKQESMC